MKQMRTGDICERFSTPYPISMTKHRNRQQEARVQLSEEDDPARSAYVDRLLALRYPETLDRMRRPQ
jgi:hypothetical protein